MHLFGLLGLPAELLLKALEGLSIRELVNVAQVRFIATAVPDLKPALKEILDMHKAPLSDSVKQILRPRLEQSVYPAATVGIHPAEHDVRIDIRVSC